MITSLTIEGFRCFERLEMGGLGRVNLIVGKNNSGKTSVLEALYLLSAKYPAGSLPHLLWRRGARLPVDSGPRRMEFDVSALFAGYRSSEGSKILLAAAGNGCRNSVEITVQMNMTDEDRQRSEGQGWPPRLKLRVYSMPDDKSMVIGFGPAGGLPIEGDEYSASTSQPPGGAVFLGPESSNGLELLEIWDKVALTRDEDVVLTALRSLDPSIERISGQVSHPEFFRTTHGGFKVTRKGNGQPVAIGSLGDGVWRMLAIATFLSQARRGVLLIDEIDAGLHYKAMAEMWKLVFQAAKGADVQVFATTHSWDCVEAFATLVKETDDANGISMQRVEAGKTKAVSYNEREIKVLAEQGVEAR
jgi:predicted ATPase